MYDQTLMPTTLIQMRRRATSHPDLSYLTFAHWFHILTNLQHIETCSRRCVTILVIILLTKFAVRVRFRCDFGKLKMCRYFTIVCDIKERWT